MLQGEHSEIFLTFIKLPIVIKIFVLSIFEWPFYTSFTVDVILGLIDGVCDSDIDLSYILFIHIFHEHIYMFFILGYFNNSHFA